MEAAEYEVAIAEGLVQKELWYVLALVEVEDLTFASLHLVVGLIFSQAVVRLAVEEVPLVVSQVRALTVLASAELVYKP